MQPDLYGGIAHLLKQAAQVGVALAALLTVETLLKPGPHPAGMPLIAYTFFATAMYWFAAAVLAVLAGVWWAVRRISGHEPVIETVGDGVTGLRPGDAVFATDAYAEYAVLDQSAVALKPRTLDFVQAAAVPMGALTAWQGIVFDTLAGEMQARSWGLLKQGGILVST